MYKFFAFLDRMKYIKRWSLMRSVREENIMEHTQQVTVIAHALALVKNRIYGGSADVEKTVLYALYHETGEVITGDLPTPIKYFNEEILGAYKDLESKAEKTPFHAARRTESGLRGLRSSRYGKRGI